jgi:hypothetical protein
MKYLRVINQVIDYPFNLDILRTLYPNTSFPENLSTMSLSDYDVFKVNEVEKPSNENFTKIVTESTPDLIGDIYFQVWIIEEAPQPYIDFHKDLKWSEVRTIRNQYLSDCDWTQLSDSPLTIEQKTAWAEYRQELRDVTLQEDPFNIVFPTKPL